MPVGPGMPRDEPQAALLGGVAAVLEPGAQVGVEAVPRVVRLDASDELELANRRERPFSGADDVGVRDGAAVEAGAVSVGHRPGAVNDLRC